MTETVQFNPAVCVCCRLSGESCRVPYVSGVLAGVEQADDGAFTVRLGVGGGLEKRITIHAAAATAGQTAILTREADGPVIRPLRAAFFHLAEEAGAWRFTPNSLLVLEPDWLFSVSDATQFEFCDRQRLVSFFTADSPSLPLIRGTLVHQLFPLLWRGCGDAELEAALNRGLEEQALKMGLAGLDPARVADDARAHLARLQRWAGGLKKQSNLVSETFRLAPGWGLKGRIDAVWERAGQGPVILGELKTGRSRGRRAARAETANGEAELGHIFQLVSYAAMLMGRGEVSADPLHACLLYSGNPDEGGRLDIVRKVELTMGNLRDTVDIRNRLVRLEMGDPPRFKDHPAACAKCRCAADCEGVARLAGHEDTRPGRKRGPAAEKADAACFQHYERLIRAELGAVSDEMARLWTSEPAARVAAGRALRLSREERVETLETGEGRRAVRRYRVEGENHSEFRAGDSVLLSDSAGPVRGRCALGTVAELGPDHVAIDWEAEPGLVPVWMDGYPDEKLTRRQWPALYRFLSRDSGLKDVLVRTRRAPSFAAEASALETAPGAASLARLGNNARQREAVERALRAEDILLVAGPPGSGKTRLIGALVEAITGLSGRPRVLLVAATNRALDQALERALETVGNLPMVRLGGEAVAAPRVKRLTLGARVRAADSVAAGGRAAFEAVRGARVIGVTASTLAGGSLDAALGDFEWVVVDEASQMTVPLGLGAASYGKRLILIGDDRQLPPVVRAAENGAGEWPALSVSLFELAKTRLAGKGPVLVELEHQFRMSDGVGAAPAAVWYGGRLRPGSGDVAKRTLKLSSIGEQNPLASALDPARPVVVADVAGSARPRVNDAEAAWVADFVAGLEACGAALAAPGAEAGVTMAVISPYRAQVARIRRELGARFPERRALWQACVDTVDRFQGGEADVVVVSLCPPAEPSDHLADERRLNVALTRARAKVVLLGDFKRLDAYPVFRRLFAEYEKKWPGQSWRCG